MVINRLWFCEFAYLFTLMLFFTLFVSRFSTCTISRENSDAFKILNVFWLFKKWNSNIGCKRFTKENAIVIPNGLCMLLMVWVEWNCFNKIFLFWKIGHETLQLSILVAYALPKTKRSHVCVELGNDVRN